MNDNLSWMNDRRLSSIPTYKLDFLQKMFFESKKLSEKERLPFLLSLAAKSRTQNITFSDEETKLIISIMKEYVPSEDVEKIDRFIAMAKSKKK